MISLDGVATIWMVGVSECVNLPLHHKVQKFSSGTGSPRWSRKKGRKMVVVCGDESIRVPTLLEEKNSQKFSSPISEFSRCFRS